MSSNFIPIVTVEEYISCCLLAAEPVDVEGLVTDPVTQDLIKFPVFMSDRVWEADTVATHRTNAINAELDYWVNPLPREKIPVNLNPVRTPRLTQVVKSIVENVTSQESAQATTQVPGQFADAQGSTAFPSDLLKDEKGHCVLINILQLAKTIGWENSIGWDKRCSWFTENLQKWFDVDQQGTLSR
jgi:hypothetical protein